MSQDRRAASENVNSEGMVRGTWRVLVTLLGVLVTLSPTQAFAQDNYEIQVYGADLVEPGRTMVELHSNFTARGRRSIVDSVSPTDHAWHETLELTRGITPWLEVGWYVFTTVQADGDWNWVGDHIRPRVRTPLDWQWPVGASLSLEFGYQRRTFATDTWTLEVRPIIDRRWGPWYWSLNPALDWALEGQTASRGLEFSPNAAISYDATPVITLGIEYYGALGPLNGFDQLRDQQHQIFPAIDLNLSPRFEVNFGVGVGLTGATDRLIVKMITGYRL